MLQRYSLFGITLEMLLVFGLFALGLILILGYAFYEHSRRKRLDKQAAGREAKPS